REDASERDPSKALLKSLAPMPAEDGLERFISRGSSLRCRGWPLVVRRPRQACNVTGARDRQAGLHQQLDHLAPGRRRQDFRFRTSLIAEFSRARSAYMRLSLAFSASSSRSRCSSDTWTPEYLLFHW